MYNPNALAQTLETASTVEQTLLDSLHGPDAAQRITDDQIAQSPHLPHSRHDTGSPTITTSSTQETWTHSYSSVHTTHNTTT